MDGQFKVKGTGIYLNDEVIPMIRDTNPKNLALVCHVLNHYGRLTGLVKLLINKPYSEMNTKQKVFVNMTLTEAENVPSGD